MSQQTDNAVLVIPTYTYQHSAWVGTVEKPTDNSSKQETVRVLITTDSHHGDLLLISKTRLTKLYMRVL